MNFTMEQYRATNPIYVTIREAAHLMRYDERTIRRKIKEGLLRAVGKGRGRRVIYASILVFQRVSDGAA